MSTSTPTSSNPPETAAKGGSRAVVIFTIATLLIALAGSMAIAVFLAILYFRPGAVGSGSSSGDGVVAEGTLVQKDTVSPKSKPTGVVYYPIAYALVPNLKLSAKSREYDIVTQTETGFTWIAHPVRQDFTDDQMFFRNPASVYEDFTWEARGVRASAAQIDAQEGTFNTIAGLEGEVTFPRAYPAAPNVELLAGPGSVAYLKVIVVESKPTGFKWKNAGKDADKDSGLVSWKSKGPRDK